MASHVGFASKAVVTEMDQQARAEAIWTEERKAKTLDKEIAQDLQPQIQAVREAEEALQKAKATLMDAVARHPKAEGLKSAQMRVQELRAQLLNEHKVDVDPKTLRTAAGDAVQFSYTPTLVIEDGEAVAEVLLKKELWVAAKATISVDADFCSALVRQGVFEDAARVNTKVGLRMIGRKE